MRVICTEGDLVGFGYINSESKQLIVTPSLAEATKFDLDFGTELGYYLTRFRLAFPNILFSSVNVSEKLFNKPLRNVWTTPLTHEERLEIL